MTHNWTRWFLSFQEGSFQCIRNNETAAELALPTMQFIYIACIYTEPIRYQCFQWCSDYTENATKLCLTVCWRKEGWVFNGFHMFSWFEVDSYLSYLLNISWMVSGDDIPLNEAVPHCDLCCLAPQWVDAPWFTNIVHYIWDDPRCRILFRGLKPLKPLQQQYIFLAAPFWAIGWSLPLLIACTCLHLLALLSLTSSPTLQCYLF